ncbi:MAG: tetratricopeptide repeat protein, partial [Deltaproteobacteria bacterium]|nr:tetratricopeptide repeat protein [Nannocystaceae bacterium]
MVARSLALRTALALALPLGGLGDRAQAAEPDAELPSPEQMSEAQARALFEAAAAAHQGQQYELAVQMGAMALEALILKVGWQDKATQASAVVVIDSLRKLGRTDEADALFAMAREKMGIPATAMPPGKQKLLASMEAFEQGRLDAAYELARDGVAMVERDQPDDTELPMYRTVLAQLHVQRQEFAQAEHLLRENLTRAEAGGDAATIAAAKNGLGSLAYSRGDYDESKRIYQEALAGANAAGAGKEAQQAHAGLGQVAFERGYTDEAILEFKARLDIAEHDFGGDERLIGALGDLGEVYENVGRFDDARPLLEREAAIFAKTYGEASPLRAGTMSRLGRLYRSMGAYDLAIDVWKRLLAIQESKLPPDSPTIGATLNNYAETLWAAGREPALLISMATRAAELNERHLVQQVSYGSEAQKRAALEAFVSGTDRVISYNVHYAPRDASATRLGVNTVLRRKGRVLDAVSGAQQALRGRLDEATRAQLDTLRERRGQVATLMVRGPAKGEGADTYRAKITQAQREVDRLERTLGDSNAVPEDLAPVELERVKAQIPEDAALLEIASYRRFDARYKRFDKAFGETHYVAYVVRRTGEPTMIPLGPAKPIDDAVAALRNALSDPKYRDVNTIAQRLDRLTMTKIRPALKNVEHVLVSPDGALNLIPFAALA